MNLSELFLQSAKTGLGGQNKDGSMPAGHNGPHNDPETPVRNTSHWLILFLKAYGLSGHKPFQEAAESCLAYLLSEEARPGGASFFHRKNPEKDFSNGVMGQAWTIEALAYAYRHFNDKKILKTVESVFTLHPYNYSVQAWKIVNPDGTLSRFDRTFNHQLWFASIGCELIRLGIGSVKEPVEHFIKHIHKNIELYPDGVIKHYPYAYSYPSSLRKTAGRFKNRLEELLNRDDGKYSHSVGYHPFNLYALAVINQYDSGIPFFKSGLFSKALGVIESDKFKKYMDKAKFGFPYNPPGIEIAVALQCGNHLSEEKRKELQQEWLNKQFQMTFDFSTYTMSKNVPDEKTNHARLYELYRLENFDLEIKAS